MKDYIEEIKTEEQTKCGEIFVNERGHINYLCLICTTSVAKAVDFDKHILLHFELCIEPNIYNNDSSNNSDTKYSLPGGVKITDSPLLLSSPETDLKYNEIHKLEIESVDEIELVDANNSQCEFCDQRFHCIGLKEAHGIGHGVGDKIFSCQYCTATFKNRIDKDEHQDLHLTCSQLLECRHCHQQFVNEIELNAHLTYDTNKLQNYEIIYEEQHEAADYLEEEPEEQQQTNKEYVEFSMAQEGLAEKTEFNLDDEDSKLTIEDDVKTANDNETQIDLHCEPCNKRFVSKRFFEVHQRRHENNTIIVIKYCDICGKSFKDRTNLKAHMRIHSGVKPYSCPICDKRFTQSSYVKAHIRLHKGEKPFQCAICGMCFFLTSKLTEHTKNHHLTLDKHKCTLCTKEYKHKRDLQYHLMLHAGERPYACDQCPRRYSVKKNLARHIKIHSNIKPYKCKLCPSAFIYLASKRAHEKRIHHSA